MSRKRFMLHSNLPVRPTCCDKWKALQDKHLLVRREETNECKEKQCIWYIRNSTYAGNWRLSSSQTIFIMNTTNWTKKSEFPVNNNTLYNTKQTYSTVWRKLKYDCSWSTTSHAAKKSKIKTITSYRRKTNSVNCAWGTKINVNNNIPCGRKITMTQRVKSHRRKY